MSSKSHKIVETRTDKYICCECGGEIHNISTDSCFAEEYDKIAKRCQSCINKSLEAKNPDISGKTPSSDGSSSDIPSGDKLEECAA